MAKSASRRARIAAEISPDEIKRPILAYLQGVLTSLNPTEQRIASALISDPERVLTSTIADFKDTTGASVGSIVKFSRKLSYKGFADFKIALARELAQSALPSDQDKPGASSIERVFKFHTKSLTETLKLNTETRLEEVADILQKARRIDFFSIGLSYPVAYTASTKMQLLGLPAQSHYDPIVQVILASQLKVGDVAFGISLSGTTRETVHCLEAARAAGATTISLTNAIESPITECSDYCLYATPGAITYLQAPLASRITQLAIIDAVFVALANRSKDRTARRLQKTGEELIKRRLDR